MKVLKIIGFSVLIGVLNALIFKVFEFLVNGGENLFWHTLINTNKYRWAVLPMTIVFSLILSWLIIFLKQKRLVTPEINSMAVDPPAKPPKIMDMGVIAIIGIASLVAGAALGPEASLVALSTTLGLIIANSMSKDKKLSQLMLLSSVGALLVAFLGSLLPLLLPIGMLYKNKALKIQTAIPPIIASLVAYGTIYLIDHKVVGYMQVNVSSKYSFEDLLLALVVGVVAAGLGWIIAKFVDIFYAASNKLDKLLPKYISVSIFGLVIGIIYIIGGPNIEFSGSTGSKDIIHQVPAYGVATLVLLIITKILVTAWSKASGYRGGLVFPSIFVGTALGLLAESLFHLTGPGVLIGASAGMITALTEPLAAFLIMASILPLDLIFVLVVGIVGATLGKKIIAKFDLTKA